MPSFKRVTASSSKELQKELRDELRMTTAMRCYSIMRSGNSKSLNSQYEYMSSLFHGDSPSIASNIKMLCSGSYVYRDMYDTYEGDTILSKSSDVNLESRPRLSLKVDLSRDKSRIYFAEEDIQYLDLEKKGRNGQQLVSGRNLLDLAKKGTANFRKALSFASKNFDLEKMSVMESGNTIDDVIEFVRIEMYQLYLKEENVKKKAIVLDCDDLDANDDSMNIEDEYLSSLQSSSTEKDVSHSSSINADCNQTKDDKKKLLSEIKRNDTSNKSDATNNNVKVKDAKTSRTVPPPQWFFPCWISFIQYGPFVPKDKRLSLLEITDASKKIVKSRAEKRKAVTLEKNIQRMNDNSSDRGFSTDQKIQLEIVDLTRQQTKDRSRESILMGLCVQEAALTKQIDRAERMAERLAPNQMDDKNNKWWSKVNYLINEQEKIINQMATLNNKAIENNEGVDNQNQQSNLKTKPLTNMSDDTVNFTKATIVQVASDLTKDTVTTK